jgi:hypothetical protein
VLRAAVAVLGMITKEKHPIRVLFLRDHGKPFRRTDELPLAGTVLSIEQRSAYSGSAGRHQLTPRHADARGRPLLGGHDRGDRLPLQVCRHGAGLSRVPVGMLEDHPHRDANPQPEEKSHERDIDPQEFGSHYSPPLACLTGHRPLFAMTT